MTSLLKPQRIRGKIVLFWQTYDVTRTLEQLTKLSRIFNAALNYLRHKKRKNRSRIATDINWQAKKVLYRKKPGCHRKVFIGSLEDSGEEEVGNFHYEAITTTISALSYCSLRMRNCIKTSLLQNYSWGWWFEATLTCNIVYRGVCLAIYFEAPIFRRDILPDLEFVCLKGEYQR